LVIVTQFVVEDLKKKKEKIFASYGKNEKIFNDNNNETNKSRAGQQRC
jgi:hypothetical protein